MLQVVFTMQRDLLFSLLHLLVLASIKAQLVFLIVTIMHIGQMIIHIG